VRRELEEIGDVGFRAVPEVNGIKKAPIPPE